MDLVVVNDIFDKHSYMFVDSQALATLICRELRKMDDALLDVETIPFAVTYQLEEMEDGRTKVCAEQMYKTKDEVIASRAERNKKE